MHLYTHMYMCYIFKWKSDSKTIKLNLRLKEEKEIARYEHAHTKY